MKNLLLILLLVCPIYTKAQDSIIFKVKYLPETEYTTEEVGTSDILMDIKGDSATLAEIARSGMHLPMHMKGENTSTSVTRTGKLLDSGLIPYENWYTNVRMKVEGMGIVKDQESPISKMRVYGKYDPAGDSEVDSITGMPSNTLTKEQLMPILKRLEQTLVFPDRPLGTGDSFRMEIHIEMPIAGMNPITLKVIAVYTLKEIHDGIAKFDVVMTMEMKTENEKFKMDASGKGTGTSDFDINKGYLKNYYTDLDITLTMLIENMTMTVKMTEVSKQWTTIK